MASFKDNGRGESPKRRLGDPRRRRASVLAMERLENRRLLSGGGGTGTAPTWKPTDANLADAQNGPIANLGPAGVNLYQEYLTYVADGAKGTFSTPLSKTVYVVGTDVGMDVRGYGNFATFEKSLVSLGMVVTATTPSIDLVEGYVPIANLPQVAADAQTVGGEPIFIPTAYQQGISPNQADVALNVAQARKAFNVNGAGQKIGVLSTDDGFTDGRPPAASVKSGDLPPNVRRSTLDDIEELAVANGARRMTKAGRCSSRSTTSPPAPRSRLRRASPAKPRWPRTSTPSSPSARRPSSMTSATPTILTIRMA